MKNNTKKVIMMSLLVSIGLVLSLVELNLPILFMVPGAKIGLSNLSVLLAIYYLGLKEGLIITFLKSLILMVATGNVISFYYGLASGLVSVLLMFLAMKYLSQDRKVFSIIGVSIIGALGHNITQIYIASIVLKTKALLYYIPILNVISIFTGGFIGYLSKLLREKIVWER